MVSLATTKMSSKGQVVIPEEVRRRLGLKAGAHFVVVGDRDAVILKTIVPPSLKSLDSLMKKARQQARQAGMNRSDIARAVTRVRGRK